MTRLYHNNEWLTEYYTTKRWSQDEIAFFCGVSRSTIDSWINKFDIEQDPFCQGLYNTSHKSWSDSTYFNYQIIYKHFTHDKKHLSQIIKNINNNLCLERWDNHFKNNVSPDNFEISNVGNIVNSTNQPCNCCGRLLEEETTICNFCYADNHNPTNNNPIRYQIRKLITPWEKQIIERDGFKCVECDETERLHAHHIVPFNTICDNLIMDYGDIVDYDFSNSDSFINAIKDDFRLWDKLNGITLCEECHINEHSRLKHLKDLSTYIYECKIIENYDGDTITVEIDLGFGLKKETTVRLFGVDTPEIRTSDPIEKNNAIKAKNAITNLCIPGRKVKIQTYKSGKFGRWLGVLFLESTIVNDLILEKQLGSSYSI